MRRRLAFTLIEVLAVVTLLGLLAGATAWSLADNARSARQRDAIDQIAHADAMARLAAERLGELTWLAIDLDRQRLVRHRDGEAGDEEAAHSVQLPTHTRLDRVRIVAGAATLSDQARQLRSGRFERGVVAIPFGAHGRSPTYAVRFSVHDEEAPGGRRSSWLVIAGLSGQATRLDDAQAMENLLDALAR